MVRGSSVPVFGAALATGLAASRSVVLARIWVANFEGALELAGSAGTPSGGGSYNRLDGQFRVMAVTDEKIASIAATRQPVIVRGLRGDEDWLTNASWSARQGVRAFIGLPLVADDLAVGVMAIFDRELPTDDTLARLEFIADIAAARAADLLRPPSPPVASPLDLRPSTGGDGGPSGRRSAGTEVLMTRAALRQIEKANIEVALQKSRGQVFGANGAAALLGMKPTTLASRIKALGIR